MRCLQSDWAPCSAGPAWEVENGMLSILICNSSYCLSGILA